MEPYLVRCPLSATHHSGVPALHFELDRMERSFVSHAPFHFPIGFVSLIPVSILAMLDGVDVHSIRMLVGVAHPEIPHP